MKECPLSNTNSVSFGSAIRSVASENTCAVISLHVLAASLAFHRHIKYISVKQILVTTQLVRKLSVELVDGWNRRRLWSSRYIRNICSVCPPEFTFLVGGK